MLNNPFISKTYQNIWFKHYGKNKELLYFDGLNNLAFYKKSWLALYANVGENMTNGVTYKISNSLDSIKNKVLLIYDVPSYYDITFIENNIRLKRISQYSGYLINLNKFDSVDSFLEKSFNKKSRSKFRGYFNKLNKNHQVEYEVMGKDLTHDTYLEVMEAFKNLLDERFDYLGLENDILNKWPFYLDVTYSMITEGKAMFSLLKIDGKIGAMSLSFISQDAVIGAIKAFDIKYKQYSLGVLELIKLIEYSILNKFKVFDLSKGDQTYKIRFANSSYLFEHHILYDSQSFSSVLLANFLGIYFKLKQYLRIKKINTWYWKLKYSLRIN